MEFSLSHSPTCIFLAKLITRLVLNSIGSDFVLRVGIPIAMSLFIDCHFLFEVQLCLSLHIEVLSFEDSEWSRGR